MRIPNPLVVRSAILLVLFQQVLGFAFIAWFISSPPGWSINSSGLPELVIDAQHSNRVDSVVFCPDGHTVVSGSHDRSIRVWDANSGRQLHKLVGHTLGIFSVACSPNGRVLASGSADKTVKLWDFNSGRELHTLTGHTDHVYSVAFSPDSRVVASAGCDKTVRLWDVTSGRELRCFNGGTLPLYAVAFSPDGRTLAAGSSEKSIKRWDLQSGQELTPLVGHEYAVYSVAFSPDGKTLASCSDQTIKLWNLASGQEIRSLTGHTKTIVSLGFRSDGQKLASCGDDHTIKLWDVSTGRESCTLSGHSGPVRSVSFSPDGHFLASGGEDNMVKVWNLPNGIQPRTLGVAHVNNIRSVCVSADGRILANACDQIVNVWDMHTGRMLHTLAGHTDYVSAVAMSPDGRTLASCGHDMTVRLWDITSGRQLHCLDGQSGYMTSLAFSPNGRALASAGFSIKLWDVSSGQELRTLQKSCSHEWLVFSPDGRMVLSGGWSNKCVKMLDVATGHETQMSGGHKRFVEAIAISPDGRTVATGADDELIKLWDAQSGQELRTLSGQNCRVTALAFSPDGRTLASGGLNSRIKLWSVNSGQEFRTLAGHENTVNALAFYGHTLTSAGEDGTVRVWDLRTTDPNPEVCTMSALNTSDWCVTDKSKHYDGSPGALNTMYWWTGTKLADLDTYKQQYYQPSLLSVDLKACLGLPGGNTAAPERPYVPPSISKQKHGDGSTQSGGIQSIQTKNHKVKDKWALVVGISHFANPKYNLKYPAKDAQDFYNFLVNEAHFQPDHIKLLVNQQATRKNIMSAFGSRWLPSVTEPDDLVVVYVSTHGTPASRDSERRNYIVAYDTEADDPYATAVDMDDLYKRLKADVKTDRALIILDTCYSGGAIPGARDINGGDNFDLSKIDVGSGHLVISSSSAGERSWDSRNYQNGVFTHNLIQALQSNHGRTDVKSAFDQLKDKVNWEVRSCYGVTQTPQIGGDWEGKDLIITVPATQPRPVFHESAESTSPKPAQAKHPEPPKPIAIGATPGATHK